MSSPAPLKLRWFGIPPACVSVILHIIICWAEQINSRRQIVKRVMRLLVFTFLVGFVPAIVTAAPPKIKKKKNGFYSQIFNGSFGYFVDTNTRSCFITMGPNIAPLQCKELARREEWKSILNWVEQ